MAEIYSAGTVDAVNGSKTLVLSGGVWSNLNVRSGDMVVVGGTHINFVETVTDTTHMEMAIAFDGATANGLAYSILHGSYEWGLHRTQNELVAQYIQGLENPVRIEMGSGVPDVELGIENAVYINTDNGDLYRKESEVWVLKLNLKGPKGDTATIAVGTVSTGAPGSAVSFENVGTPEDAVFDISIPKGDAGDLSPGIVSLATTEKARLLANGNFGIGTLIPQVKYHVVSSGGGEVARFEADNSVYFSLYNAGVRGAYFQQAGNDLNIVNEKSGKSRIYTNDLVRVTVDKDGNVGFANDNPVGIFELGSFSVTGATEGRNFTASGRNMNSSAISTAPQQHMGFSSPNGVIGSVVTTNSTTSYNTTSDHRLKVTFGQIVDATALDKIMAVPIYDLAFKKNPLAAVPDDAVEDDSRQIGALAHELAVHFPWAVSGEKDEVDLNGDPVNQMVNYPSLVMTTFAAIQELKRKQDALDARLTALEA